MPHAYITRRSSCGPRLAQAPTAALFLFLGACGGDSQSPSDGAGPPEAAVLWLQETARPLAGLDPGGGGEDLEVLRDLVGDASVVVLGESTHGTREFTRLKHRVFRLLAQDMGFSHFILEASWPEALLVDRYVREGEGEVREVQSRLFRWFWNTGEMLELLRWMRAENQGHAPGGRLGFGGMDVQFPLLAMDTVLAFLDRVDPEGAAAARDLYSCFLPYVNNEDGTFDLYFQYTELPGREKSRCRERSAQVHRRLVDRADSYRASVSVEEVERAIQSARLVFQNQHIRVNSVADQDTRDMYLAENALWELRRAGPGARAVVSTHNFHAIDEGDPWPSTGRYLKRALGEDVVLIGLTALLGRFNAFDPDEGRVGSHQLPEARVGSWEEFLARADHELTTLDLRAVGAASPGARNWLLATHPAHFIGSRFRAGQSYLEDAALALELDAVIQVAESTPTSLLPITPPTTAASRRR